MLGLEGAGKTTFLYKLKINGYKKADVTQDMVYLKAAKQDPGYHFEELSSPTIGQYSIWEVPGNDVMRPLWPMFYRYLRIHGVFFVVDAFSEQCFDLDKENFRKLSKARDALFQLVNEDELRVSVFFLVLNVKRSTEDAARKEEEDTGVWSWSETGTELTKQLSLWVPKEGPGCTIYPTKYEAAPLHSLRQEQEENALFEMLGVPEIEQMAHMKTRFRKVVLNCANISRKDSNWENILKELVDLLEQCIVVEESKSGVDCKPITDALQSRSRRSYLFVPWRGFESRADLRVLAVQARHTQGSIAAYCEWLMQVRGPTPRDDHFIDQVNPMNRSMPCEPIPSSLDDAWWSSGKHWPLPVHEIGLLSSSWIAPGLRTPTSWSMSFPMSSSSTFDEADPL
eukprot:g27247.t1